MAQVEFSEDRSPASQADIDPAETAEWLESLEDVLNRHGPARVTQLLALLDDKAHRAGVELPFTANTPYINSIPVEQQPPYPGNREIERRIKSIIRWNAMAMVVRANRGYSGLGGHISTFASAATLYEVGFNHFFRTPDGQKGDLVYFQGHAAPGVYARAMLEGRLDITKLHNFRRELQPGGGLSSYPHPWLMPHFWQFPTVSMGLGPITAIYQARFLRYLHDRGLKDTSNYRVWCFVGDGECDEPESLGALTLASRERLDNLIFVINCNLQRLDGPVRGNGKIIQELEAAFRGAGWHAIKVIWGSDWDPLLAADEGGVLAQRMAEVVDGQYQKYSVSSGDYIREHFFGKSPELLSLVRHLSDEQLQRLNRGGHDPEKVFAAYQSAVQHEGAPKVILCKTVKGYGLGEAGEGRNITHQQKKMNDEELREFRSRFGIPIGDDDIHEAPFYCPTEDSPEQVYLQNRREALGGYLPTRTSKVEPLEIPELSEFEDLLSSSGDREVSTTMGFVNLLRWLLRNKALSDLIVPIIPDEARTFGMDPLFRQCGIYAHGGQLYEPVDAESFLYYREAKSGQILEEGITEAGSMSSFIAAGTAYSTLGVPTVPFFIYYSMFGFQRIGDLIWLAADSRCRGFLLGGTAGRTTLSGEGLQHQDGHSHLIASTVPNLLAYDPAFNYETTVIIQDGLRRMYQEQEDIFYYLTLYNENYIHPELPEKCETGILKGCYKFSSGTGTGPRAQLLGSGPILLQVLEAQGILEDRFDVSADVWSVTSYKELRREALATDRWNTLHPGEPRRSCYVEECFGDCEGPIVSASDNMKMVGEQISRWLPPNQVFLGTDGFGRSETRESLRRHFEIDASHIVFATLSQLARMGQLDSETIERAKVDLEIDPDKIDPAIA